MSIRMMADVWELDLHRELKMVLLAFADHADDEGRCFPSLERIAHKCGYSRASVKRKTHALVDAGLLVVLREGNGRGKPSVYQVCPEKGVRLTPFGQRKRVRASTEKGSTSEAKGVAATTPESSVTINPEPLSLFVVEEPSYTSQFEDLWAIHPRGSKKKAFAQYRKATYRNGKPPRVDHDTLMACLRSYVDTELGPKFAGHDLERWIRDDRWEQEIAKGCLRKRAGDRVFSDTAARFL